MSGYLGFRWNIILMPVEARKRGRPATGRDPMMGFRAAPVLRACIVRWAENQADRRSLSEATRRLVELGLNVKTKGRRPGNDQKSRARELAAKAIDRITDSKLSTEDQASRKRRSIRGPEEFRKARVDLPRKK
jgi:hypothetical protein